MKILFTTIFYNRPKISEVYLLGYQRLKKHNPDIELLVCCSDKESIELCKRYEVDYCYHENLPIGQKNNNLFYTILKNYNPDYIIHSGDDDLLSNKMLDLLIGQMKQKSPYIGTNSLYFWDYRQNWALSFKYKFSRTNVLIGAFRCFSRELLENFIQDEKFTLWDWWINKGLDYSSEKHIFDLGIRPVIIKTEKPEILAIKSEYNMWGIAHFVLKSEKVPVSDIEHILGEEEKQYLISL